MVPPEYLPLQDTQKGGDSLLNRGVCLVLAPFSLTRKGYTLYFYPESKESLLLPFSYHLSIKDTATTIMGRNSKEMDVEGTK